MKKWKKLLIGTGLAVTTLMLTTACGSSKTNGESSDGKVTIKFSAWDKFPTDFFKEFEKENPNIKVEMIQIPDSDYSQKINQMVAGGTAPDVILQFETDLPKMADAGAIEDLTPYIKKSKIDTNDFIPAVKALQSETKGKMYGLPWAYAPEILFYNKDMFDKAGVDYPNKDWTWDDFEKAAEKLTIRDGNKVTQWGADSLSFRGLWWSLAGQGGDKVVSNGQLKLGDGLTAALDYQNKLTNKLKVSPAPSGSNSVSDLFASGQAAMTRTGSWMGLTYKDVDFHWDIETLPKDKKAYNSLHTGFYTINSSSKHKDAAWKLVDFFMSEKGQEMNSKWGGNPSALKSIADKGAWKNPGKNGPTNWDAITRAGEQGAFGYTLVNATQTTDLVNQFDAYLLGNTSKKDIFNKYIPAANKELEKDK